MGLFHGKPYENGMIQGENPPFSELPQIFGPFERTNCSFAPSGFIETCQLLAHKVTESRPEGFSTIQCTQKLFLGEDGGLWMWKLKRDQGKHRKNQLPIGGAMCLEQKETGKMQVTWGKICLKKAPWKKKDCPREQKHNLRGINLMHSSGGDIKQVFTQIHLFSYSISLSSAVICP